MQTVQRIQSGGKGFEGIFASSLPIKSNIALLLLGGLVLGRRFWGYCKERLWLSDPLVVLLVGVLFDRT